MLIEMRMDVEIATFVIPGRMGRGGARGLSEVEGLVGEYEVEMSSLGVRQVAGILGEYVLDTLRGQGWFVQL